MGTKEDKLMLIEWLTKLEDKDTVERIKTIKSEYDTQKQPYFKHSGPLRIEESSNSLQNIVREEIVVYTRIKDGIKIWRY